MNRLFLFVWAWLAISAGAQTIWVEHTNNSYYISAPWTNSSRWELEVQVTNTAQLTGDHRYKAIVVRPNTNVTDHVTAGTTLGSLGDDIGPLNLLAGYVSGDHGWLINKVTWPTHSATVGDQLKDAGGHLFAVTEIVDASTFWIAPNNATGPYMSMTAGNLTNVTQATFIGSGAWSYTQEQKFPSWLTSTNSFRLDGNVLAINSVSDGTVFEACLRHTLFDVRSAYAAALGNPAFTYASLAPLLTRTLTTRVYGNCQLTITDAIQSLAATNWTVGYFGGMQCAPKSASTYYWFPNSKAIAGVDLSIPVACTEVNSTTYWTNNAQCATDTNLGLNVFWTFDDVTVGASTNYSTGQVLLYDPDFGDSSMWIRNVSTSAIWQINGGTQKLYPENLVGVVMSNGDTKRLTSYRKWFPATGSFYNTVQVKTDIGPLWVTGGITSGRYRVHNLRVNSLRGR